MGQTTISTLRELQNQTRSIKELKTEIETVGPATQLEKIRHGLKFFELRLSNYFNWDKRRILPNFKLKLTTKARWFWPGYSFGKLDWKRSVIKSWKFKTLRRTE